uniref:Uncharacterized protein n=1 Tax=Pyramimonas orientalis virus TaxID=455367 RepID=A0A7M3UNP7_POV01|nr:hypothetical protein HWQ62_00185 [Pyramimonas orientalis virus]
MSNCKFLSIKTKMNANICDSFIFNSDINEIYKSTRLYVEGLFPIKATDIIKPLSIHVLKQCITLGYLTMDEQLECTNTIVITLLNQYYRFRDKKEFVFIQSMIYVFIISQIEKEKPQKRNSYVYWKNIARRFVF